MTMLPKINAYVMTLAGVILIITFYAPSAAATTQYPLIEQNEFLKKLMNGEQIINRKIPAQLIEGIINMSWSKPLKIEGCDIVGDLNLSGREITFDIAVASSKFEGKIDFRKANFKKDLNFSRVDFGREVLFDGAAFQSEVNITEGVFNGEVLLNYATFASVSSFSKSIFKKGLSCDITNFEKYISFDRVTFSNYCSFNETQFNGRASFRYSKVEMAIFSRTRFANDVIFDLLGCSSNDCEVHFFGVTFQGRTFFDGANIPLLDMSIRIGPPEEYGRFEPPSVFEKTVSFRGLKSKRAFFNETIFQSYVDFTDARFTGVVDFTDTVFEGPVNFLGVEFPNIGRLSDEESSGVNLDGVRIEKEIRLDWEQLVERKPWWQAWRTPPMKVKTQRMITWLVLEEAFRKSGQLEGQNEAMYQRRLMARRLNVPNEYMTANYLSWLFWGYGVRPWRLVGWIFVVYLFFGFIYWTQTKQLSKRKKRIKGLIDRVRFALKFSSLTSWSIGYGYKNSRTPFFKFITLAHSVLFKLMLLCLLQVIANVSPLLNSLVGKLLPL